MLIGANPKLFGSRPVNRPELSNTTWDIFGAGPRALHVPLENKPETNMFATDIEGTVPQKVKFISKRFANNPLEPRYKLPKAEGRPPTPPRFLRDAMKIDDLPGTKPKVDKLAGRPTRDVLRIDDILGTRSRQRHKPR